MLPSRESRLSCAMDLSGRVARGRVHHRRRRGDRLVRAAEAAPRATRDGWLTLCDASGRPVVESAGAPRSDTESGFGAEFALQEDEAPLWPGRCDPRTHPETGDRSRIWVVNVKSPTCPSPM